MTVRRQDEQIVDDSGQRAAIADRPIARYESVVQEQSGNRQPAA